MYDTDVRISIREFHSINCQIKTPKKGEKSACMPGKLRKGF